MNIKEQIIKKLIDCEMEGYILGLDRSPGSEYRFKSHIYEGTFDEPGNPMCSKGWNRDNGTGYSIWRNNLGTGICSNCLKNVMKKYPDSTH